MSLILGSIELELRLEDGIRSINYLSLKLYKLYILGYAYYFSNAVGVLDILKHLF